jgi:hypothetical protein
VVGSGPNDLDASADAFDLLERIVAARLGRGLSPVVDTLGLDEARRTAWLAAARAGGLPAMLILFDTPPELCRERNRQRDRPVPAQVLAGQLRKAQCHRIKQTGRESERAPRRPLGLTTPTWLTGIATAADRAGFAGLALMDHLVQIPQVGRAWEPIPEPWVTLGLGAGWWEREHAAYGVPFPPAHQRLDAVEAAIATMRALWAPGTKEAGGRPETTSYPRPAHHIPIIVGGSGERTLRIGARLADAVNVRTEQVDRALAAVDGTGTKVTVLDLPTVGATASAERLAQPALATGLGSFLAEPLLT